MVALNRPSLKSPEPVIVTFFGKRIFADAIKLNVLSETILDYQGGP